MMITGRGAIFTGLLVLMAAIAAVSLLLWRNGYMVEHGMIRTVSWSGLAIVLLIIQYAWRSR